MAQGHPITPPPELVMQWLEDGPEDGELGISKHIATQAAQWGADQELEACINFLYDNELCDPNFYNDLRNHRRPKPPSLKEQALQALAHLENGAHCSMDTTESAHYIRRALESLPD
jgi:hypothetical protein